MSDVIPRSSDFLKACSGEDDFEELISVGHKTGVELLAATG